MDIKKVISSRGFTLKNVADRIGISQQAVSQAVNGNPSLSRLKEIADAIGVSVSELLSDDDSMEKTSITCPHCGKTINIKLG